MAVKLIMTDLDGTLFRNDHESISDRNVNALKTAKELKSAFQQAEQNR